MNRYYSQRGERVGPVSDDDLIQLAATGAIGLDTQVCRVGMDKWMSLSVALDRAPSLASSPDPDDSALLSESPRILNNVTRARVAIAFLGIMIALDGFAAVLGFRQLGMLHSLTQGLFISESEIQAHDELYGLIGAFQSIAYFITAIAFVMWFFRARDNLPRLGAKHLKYGPGWTVGGWFVPFLNLIRPFQVASEIWRESTRVWARRAGDDPRRPGDALVGLWWLLFLTMNALSMFALRITMDAEGISRLITATRIMVAAEVAAVLCAIAAIRMITRIQRWQVAATPPTRPEKPERQDDAGGAR